MTGHNNYLNAGKALGVDFVSEPALVSSPKYAALTAGYFWSSQKLNTIADDILALTKRINGGTIGLDDRIAHTDKAFQVLMA